MILVNASPGTKRSASIFSKKRNCSAKSTFWPFVVSFVAIFVDFSLRLAPPFSTKLTTTLATKVRKLWKPAFENLFE